MSIASPPRELGRYVVFDQIASGGMATVHLGRMHGAIGFSRIVAIKRLHANYASDEHFVQMFLDEARLAARVKHPNVVATIDVVADEAEVFLVMEYVLGESLEALMLHERASIPLPIIAAIMCAMLEGLHAAHEAEGDTGEPLDIVHRDVSPHNVIVGADGTARVFDFGIAKAAINTQETRDGVVKGKVSYMAPEQVRGAVDRRADIYSAGVILWELLVGMRLHAGERNDQLFLKLATNELEPPTPPSMLRTDVPEELDDIVLRATALDVEERFSTAREMALAIEAAVHPALPRDVSEWVRRVAGERLARLSSLIQRIEGDSQAPSGITLSLSPPYSSSSSIRAAASTRTPSSMRVPLGATTRSGELIVGTSVSPVEHITGSHGAGVAPPRRSWTMPAALLAFTAVMLLVGLRMLTRTAPSTEAREGQGPAMTVEPLPELPEVSAPPSTRTGTTARATATTPASGDAGAHPGELLPLTRPPAPAPATPPARTSHWVPPPPPARSKAPPPPAKTELPAPRAADVAPVAPAPAAPPAAAPAAAGGAKAGCENPFAIGPDGIRQIKPECM